MGALMGRTGEGGMRMGTRLLLAAAALLAALAAAQASTLDDVRRRGELRCGVNTGLAGFAAPDDKGEWRGIDADFCRAVAAAVFGANAKVKFVPLNAKERFTALQSGEVDLLSRNTTWTMSRDTSLGLSFTGIMYYDGQGFIVRKSLGLKSVSELAGASICVQTGTTNELNLADYFTTNKLSYRPVVFERLDEMISAYNSGRCDSFTTDTSQLISERIGLPNPDDSVILPELISREPLGPAVRQGDDQWAGIVRWTHFAMLNAEAEGVTQKNVEEMLASPNPAVRRLLGVEGGFGAGLGLSNDWAVQIIRTVGNYAESFERNLGTGSPLKIPRGMNALWKDGGLHYPPPIR
jgi:general L-amino acid transport system substrate-binding protein